MRFLKRIYIIKYNKQKRNKCIAATYDLKEARDYCSRAETRSDNWFCGWTMHEPEDYSPSTPNLSDMLKDLDRLK